MSEIAHMGEDFGPTSPIGIAIDSQYITDPGVTHWDLYEAIQDILREELARHRNRVAGVDATGRNQMGRITRKATQQEEG